MRIVAGSARGRPLIGPGPKSKDIRPTADRVRQTIFNVLGQWLDGVSVLDLYAGTGALALESLSRGAEKAVLVDSGREALELCRANTEALGFGAKARILPLPVARALERLAGEGAVFELVFADPPYAAKAVEDVLSGVEAKGLLASTGTLVVEHDKREAVPERHGGLQRVDQRTFGDTVVSFYRFA